MHDVWGWTFGDTSTVTVHVRRLREKVEDDPTAPTLIRTVWGVGYRARPAAVRPTATRPCMNDVVTAILWAAIAATLAWFATWPLRRRSISALLLSLTLTCTAASAGAMLGAVHSMLVPMGHETAVLVVSVAAGLLTAVAAVAAARRLSKRARGAAGGGRRPGDRRARAAGRPSAEHRTRTRATATAVDRHRTQRLARSRAGTGTVAPRTGRVDEPRPAHPARRSACDGRGARGRRRRRSEHATTSRSERRSPGSTAWSTTCSTCRGSRRAHSAR